MKILVVDDDKTFRTMVKAVLEEEGYEVTTAENGVEAWEGLQENKVDMAILDVNMPGMDGFQLLRKIRGDNNLKEMPVLMLTIRAFADDQVHGYESGADDYLTKPFANDILLARIKVLARRILKRNGD